MKKKISIAVASLFLLSLPAAARMFNFSFQSSNQEIIEEALTGAFVGVTQSYELCDTVSNQHFGRDGKAYFSRISFLGIETEKGLIIPQEALSPWEADPDFEKYSKTYKPLITMTDYRLFGSDEKEEERVRPAAVSVDSVSSHLSLLPDSLSSGGGLQIDSVGGEKSGWIVWVCSEKPLSQTDSLIINPIRRDISVPADGGAVSVEQPEIDVNILGGVFVVPERRGVGKIVFTLSGVLVYDGKGWQLDFPFAENVEEKDVKKLTPIIGGNPFSPNRKMERKDADPLKQKIK